MRARLILLVLFLALTSCKTATVPETGRKRYPLKYSDKEMEVLGAEAYEAATKDYTVITNTDDAELVQEVGRRLADATGKTDYEWEFRLLDAPEIVNAFCLPGGKVAVFSGILPITESDDGLAVVLGHEAAHATLEHGNERMSQPTLKRIIGLPVTIGAGVWGAISPGSRRVVMGAFGIGSLVGELLPYSQEHEFEADQVGLEYMRKAGFDVEEAPKFWQRMIDATGVQKSDALSTHPDAEKRIKRLEELIRKIEEKDGAKKGAEPSATAAGPGAARPARVETERLTSAR